MSVRLLLRCLSTVVVSVVVVVAVAVVTDRAPAVVRASGALMLR